ncbi:CaiB/BaiF CoA transferase family protein, partial [Amycolatopsis pretoriensis]
MTDQPLAGRTVIDLTTALAGPYATLLLAGLGATVIKVENPATGGDSSRNNAPYVGRDGLNLARRHEDDLSVSMLLRGRNKLSVTLDLKNPRSRAVFTDLVRDADVLVENYSPGVTDRLGISYDHVREINPRLVYTSISGFGAQGGPGSGKAMDSIIQALSGVMMTAGEPDEGPVRFGLPIGDLLAPLFAVVGTVSALLQAEHTGEGQRVDVSMLGALTSLVACEPFDAFDAVGLSQRTGSMVPRLAPFGILPALDGYVALCAPTDAFAHGVLRAIGRPELAGDDRYRTRDQRVR